MDISYRRALGLAVAAAALVGFGQMTACTTDEDDPGPGTGGRSASYGGAAGAAGEEGGTVCANPTVLTSESPGIADFEAYDGSDISTWFFALGGDSSTDVVAGPFVYGDEPDGNPETSEMSHDGHDSDFALRIADTLAEEYGGGMGLWISSCLDASAFTGISFWVRGNAPTGTAVITLLMEESTSSTPETADSQIGTCPGTDAEENCIHPSFTFDVPEDGSWAQVEVQWNRFQGGLAVDAAVPVDGHNIWQIQFDIGLEWVEGDPDYVPVAAPYELVVDDLTFY